MASETNTGGLLDPTWLESMEDVQQKAQRVLQHLDVTELPAFWKYRGDLLAAVAAVMRSLAAASLRINAEFQARNWDADPESGLPVATEIAQRMAKLQSTVQEINRRLVNIRKVVDEPQDDEAPEA